MPETPVISNNTPLVALWTINQLTLLRDLFSTILIPPAVYDEFVAIEQASRQKSLEEANWIQVTKLSNPRTALPYTGLDKGEAEVLALAVERSARLVIMDERNGRRYANRIGLPLTGTLGLLLLGKEAGFLKAVTPLIEQLQNAGLYLKPDLVQQVLQMADEQI